MLKQDDIIELTIEKLINTGSCLSHYEGKAVFIDGAVPEDIVKARVLRINKNFIRAKIIEIVTPSKHRIKPFCPLFNACGGCNLQNIEYDFLIKQKENILKETFRNFKETEFKPFLKCDNLKEYRCKVQNAVSETKVSKRILAGYYKENSHDVVNIKFCPIQPKIIDEIINGIYQNSAWGYSLPNYISAKHNAHPNYAGFLDDKKTLTVEDMENIFQLMEEEKKYTYDKNYIEELYTRYLATGRIQDEHKEELEAILRGKKVLLVAPGKSSLDEKDKILAARSCMETVCISVNFDYEDADFIFLSNLRRYKALDTSKYKKCIITSNITGDKVYLQIKYRNLLNEVEAVKDNAGLMAVKFLSSYGVKEIMLAGFDGYSHDVKENYGDSQMEMITRNAVLDAMNVGMTEVLRLFSRDVKISFLTSPRHIEI